MRKYIIFLLLILVSSQAFAATRKYQLYGIAIKLHFDKTKISPNELDEIMQIHPQYHFGFAERVPDLTQCRDNPPYKPCGKYDVESLNFFHNAEINLSIGKKGIMEIDNLKIPKTLKPLHEYAKREIRFRHALTLLKLRLLQGEKSIENNLILDINPAIQCRKELDIFHKVADLKSKYRILQLEVHNCLYKAHRPKGYLPPMSAWEDFKDEMNIREEELYYD